MSINQLHGKTYEDHIKSAFQGSADHGRISSSIWDIEAAYDNILHLPTSIKTSKTDIITLADARRFWSINEGYRLLACMWEQKDKSVKYFHKLYEFLITLEEHHNILGEVTFDEIQKFHNDIKSYGTGRHQEARNFAQEQKKLFVNKTIIILNPKIDSKQQRRLQCSITIDNLQNHVKAVTIYDENNPFYKEIDITLKIKSSARKFKDIILDPSCPTEIAVQGV